MKKERFRCHVAVCLMLIQEEKVLLIERANTGFADGLYSLPAGAIDGSEPIKQALIREIKEELGITIFEKDLEFITVLHVAPRLVNPHELILFCFKTTKYEGVIRNAEPHKCSDVRFFSFDNLPKNILDTALDVFKNYKKGAPFEELYWK